MTCRYMLGTAYICTMWVMLGFSRCCRVSRRWRLAATETARRSAVETANKLRKGRAGCDREEMKKTGTDRGELRRDGIAIYTAGKIVCSRLDHGRGAGRSLTWLA